MIATDLPVAAILPEIARALEGAGNAVVVAAPGAGKTTVIPLALKDAAWLAEQTIVMLEPRRLAARLAAGRMAAMLGEDVGATVGYRVRLESRVSDKTRIEVVTEGILTRRLQREPDLAGIGLLIFDEFHERSLDADLALALALDVQRALRPELKILVMSATLDGAAVAGLLGGAPVLQASHRPHPVATRYLDRARAQKAGPELTTDMAALIRRALSEEAGSVLAFLPGEGEIRRTQSLLEEAGLPGDVTIAPLYGALTNAEQARAIEPAPAGRRKVVLATTIAETSLTIEGVRVVVDCGYKRAPRFNVRRAMTELETVRVSRASAEQRRGRAGRLGPGVCYRLWSEPEDLGLAAFDAPEMLTADLAPLALDLAAWGVRDPLALSWLTPPPAGAYDQALALLRRLDAVDAAGRVTAEGKAMAALPLHPRLAHMIHRAKAMDACATAADAAALLSERDVLRHARDADFTLRLEALRGKAAGDVSRGAVKRVQAAAQQIRRLARCDGRVTPAEAGRLLALAYPDRIGQRRGAGRYRLSGGGGAQVDPAEPLAAHEFLAVADMGGGGRDGRVYLAAPVTRADLEQSFANDIADQDVVAWDNRTRTVLARRQRRLGALILEDRPLSAPDVTALQAAMVEGVRSLGLAALPWDEGTSALRARVAFLKRARPAQAWPDLSDAALLADLEHWLGPFLVGVTRADQLHQIDLNAALMALLPWPLPAELDAQAPTHIPVPSGSHVRVDYGADGGPAVSVKLQEVFGLTTTPTVAGVPVTLHLLSPAQRPLAVTRDLASFWANVYPHVRGEMRGRYPRHNWPEDPLTAIPSRRSIKPRGT